MASAGDREQQLFFAVATLLIDHVPDYLRTLFRKCWRDKTNQGWGDVSLAESGDLFL